MVRNKKAIVAWQNDTFGVLPRLEWPDDPDAVGLGGPADVDDGGVEPVQDGAPQHGQPDALRDDDLDPGPELLPDGLLDQGRLGEAADEEEVAGGRGVGDGGVGQDPVDVLKKVTFT